MGLRRAPPAAASAFLIAASLLPTAGARIRAAPAEAPAPAPPDPFAATIARLRSPDILDRDAAEADLAALGAGPLPRLALALAAEDDPDARVRIETVLRDALGPIIEQWKSRHVAIARAQAELRSIEGRPSPPGPSEADVARAQVLRERIRSEAEAIGRANGEIRALGPAAHPLLFPLSPYWPSPARAAATALWEEAVAASRGDPDPGDRFDAVRYLLSHIWRVAARGGEGSERAAAHLARHIERTFDDAFAPARTRRIRDRAVEELFLLDEEALAFLAKRAPPMEGGAGHDARRILVLLARRIPDSLARRTGIDLVGFEGRTWIARRSAVYELERIGRQEAIPALRRILHADASLSVQVSAAEALARLQDGEGIRYLEEKGLEELSKLPAVSRQVFIIEAIRMREAGDLDGSIRKLRAVLDESPEDFRANYELAFTLLLAKRFQEAIQHFRRALEAEAKDTLALYNLACAYALAGQGDEALDALQAAVESGFDDADHIEADRDLESLRDRDRFRKIIEGLRAKEKEEEGR